MVPEMVACQLMELALSQTPARAPLIPTPGSRPPGHQPIAQPFPTPPPLIQSPTGTSPAPTGSLLNLTSPPQHPPDPPPAPPPLPVPWLPQQPPPPPAPPRPVQPHHAPPMVGWDGVGWVVTLVGWVGSIESNG